MTIKTKTHPMQELYRRLQEIGIKKAYVSERILPEWWEEEAALTPTGFQEACGYIARRLGIELATLLDGDAEIAFRDALPVAFKSPAGKGSDDLVLAKNIAIQAGILLVGAAGQRPSLPATTAAQIREELLTNAKQVNLETVLDYCWNSGIAVAHIAHFPDKKMDGLALRSRGRSAIILSKNAKSPAKQLFILAHELGHLTLNHLNDDAVLVDTEVSNTAGQQNQYEVEANEFAVELISGEKETKFGASSWPRAAQLAAQALALSKEYNTDPGFILLNFGWHSKNKAWGLVEAALKIVDDDKNGTEMIQQAMLKNLDLEALPDESVDYLLRITAPV